METIRCGVVLADSVVAPVATGVDAAVGVFSGVAVCVGVA